MPHADLRRGGVACVVHSGSLGEALLHAGPRFGLRVVVSSGNELGRDVADWLATLAADDETTVIGLALEAIRRPAAFAEALALAARAGKPVIVLASGRSQAASRAALAHSGAVAGTRAGARRALRRPRRDPRRRTSPTGSSTSRRSARAGGCPARASSR